MINQLKTIILFAALTALFLFVGQLFGGTTGVIIALVIAILFNGLMYWFSSKIVLSLYGAKEADPKAYKELYSQVRHVAHLANIPMPKIYIIDSKTPNAFATGRNPKNGIVAFTTGILELLNKQELEGVIAHEIAHIKNRDILIQTIAATIAGAISYIASLAQWAAIFGMGDDDGPNWLQLLILIIV
ncbi:MAG: M48 family metalloprotease, partial [Candidatus Woesearchaeota archaeon]